MTSSLDLMGALLVGLAGSGHCIAMCGGVSAALSMAKPASPASRALVVAT